MATPAEIRLAPLLRGLPAVVLGVLLLGCQGEKYRTFADFPGFRERYEGYCTGEAPPGARGRDVELLVRYRPRLFLPPGNRYPIDFYRDYLPFAALRTYPEGRVVAEEVTPRLLDEYRDDLGVYLDFDIAAYKEAGLDVRAGERPPARPPVVYGRVYREEVRVPCPEKAPAEGAGGCAMNLIFLKYNMVFAMSGLPRELPRGRERVLRLLGMDPWDWHELDNFVAAHVVLDEEEEPVALMLAQHNHHRSYMTGRHVHLPDDGRIPLAAALRSNEIYIDDGASRPVRHRVARWSRYMKYILSGRDPPFFRGHDVTFGRNAGGEEAAYSVAFPSPCDPLYRAEILLGEPRLFLGTFSIGRDGPPGSDYYAVPELLPLGNLLMFSYLRDDDPADLEAVEEAVNPATGEMDYKALMEHGGGRFYRDLVERTGGVNRSPFRTRDGIPAAPSKVGSNLAAPARRAKSRTVVAHRTG